jgi:hypothetical protein
MAMEEKGERMGGGVLIASVEEQQGSNTAVAGGLQRK